MKSNLEQSNSSSPALNVLRNIKNFRETTIIIIVAVICVFLSIVSPAFLTGNNIRTTLIGLSANAIVAIGMTICLIAGGFDLSVGSMLALAGIITTKLFSMDVNIWVSTFIGMLVVAAFGLANGLCIGKIKLNALITTLGTMTVARGACYIITSGTPITLATTDKAFDWLGTGDLWGIPSLVIIMIVLVVTFDFLLRRSKGMRKVFYVGSNEKTAALSGINVASIKVKVFLLSSCLAGFAGILSVSRFGVASPTLGNGLEMSAISAAVIGGASISGGEGTILGTTLGVILLALINNGLVLLNVSIYWQQLVSGAVLLTAVLLDHISNQKRMQKSIMI